MRHILFSLILNVLIFSAPAQAQELSTLSEFVTEQVSSLEAAFNDISPVDDSGIQGEDKFIFRRFWLRVRAKVGLTIPELAALDLIPEIEMLWEKEVPEGWETYKP